MPIVAMMWNMPRRLVQLYAGLVLYGLSMALQVRATLGLGPWDVFHEGVAERTGLYLDLTGLGCYHKQDVPAWYDQLSEPERWAVQARFWAAIARTCDVLWNFACAVRPPLRS